MRAKARFFKCWGEDSLTSKMWEFRSVQRTQKTMWGVHCQRKEPQHPRMNSSNGRCTPLNVPTTCMWHRGRTTFSFLLFDMHIPQSLKLIQLQKEQYLWQSKLVLWYMSKETTSFSFLPSRSSLCFIPGSLSLSARS